MRIVAKALLGRSMNKAVVMGFELEFGQTSTTVQLFGGNPGRRNGFSFHRRVSDSSCDRPSFAGNESARSQESSDQSWEGSGRNGFDSIELFLLSATSVCNRCHAHRLAFGLDLRGRVVSFARLHRVSAFRQLASTSLPKLALRAQSARSLGGYSRRSTISNRRYVQDALLRA